MSDSDRKPSPMCMKIATWNVNRPVNAARREAIRAEIDKIAADILVLTEAHDGFYPGLPFSCSSAPGRDGTGRYKSPEHHWVTIWSHYRLEKIETSDHKRTTAARIFPSEGAPFLTYGTVLPWEGDTWHDYPSTGGVAFGEALKVQVFDWKKLHCQYPSDELFVLGDFNQDLAITPYRGTKLTRSMLSVALNDCGLVALTAGDNDPVRRDSPRFACIDHICAFSNSPWRPERTERWPNTPEPNMGPSDHFGVAITLALHRGPIVGHEEPESPTNLATFQLSENSGMSKTIEISAVADAVRLLDAHPDFKVIRRIPLRTAFAADDGRVLSKGVVVDTETTGLDPDKDAIIELGMVLFEFDQETGRAYRILGTFSQLEAPRFTIPMESIAVHGITNEMVAGKRIDDAGVEQFLDGVSLVVAHHSKFDRVFLEKRLPIFESLPWGCSLAQVDWRGEGFGSASLDYIAYQYGFFFDEHRAENDCFALMEVLQQHLPKSGDLVLKSILHKLGQKSYTVYATGSPYETKDILKSRGYRWDGERKCWHTTVTGDEAIKDETCWLKSHIYDGNKAKIEIEVNTCLTQFSNRIGNRVTSEI